MKIEVKGASAKLYVHGNAQPALVVNDLKLGTDAAGSIGLWIGRVPWHIFRDFMFNNKSY